jgi:hypothetical protein
MRSEESLAEVFVQIADTLVAEFDIVELNRPGFARGWGSGHLAPLGDGVSIHDFAFNRCQVIDG